MVDYSKLKVNEDLKPRLRAIGQPFPSTKKEMVEILEKYDKEHPDRPASSLPIPSTQPRKKRVPKGAAPAPAATAQKKYIVEDERTQKGLGLGRYAGSEDAKSWPVKSYTGNKQYGEYVDPRDPRYLPIEALHGQQWKERYIKDEEAKGVKFDRMPYKSPKLPNEKEFEDAPPAGRGFFDTK